MNWFDSSLKSCLNTFLNAFNEIIIIHIVILLYKNLIYSGAN